MKKYITIISLAAASIINTNAQQPSAREIAIEIERIREQRKGYSNYNCGKDFGWGGWGQYFDVPLSEKGKAPEEPQLEGISPEVIAANPLVRPPRPIEYMPVEQQIYWNECLTIGWKCSGL